MPFSARYILGILLALQLVAIVANAATTGIDRFRADESFHDRPAHLLAITHLAAIGCLALAVAWRRRPHVGFWILVGAGCWYLWFDATFALGEAIETAIEHALQLGESGWSRRLDDFFLAAFALAGLAALFVHRQELARFHGVGRLYLAGLVLLFGMVALDIAGAQIETVIPRFGKTASTGLPFAVLEFMEDAMMLTGLTLWLVATADCLHQERRVRDRE
ncbi:MAG: hypothetical protein KDA42_08590 [Planctomycetales bacterium]|nr:hypothetical protein [Planctomycetales bacterium]